MYVHQWCHTDLTTYHFDGFHDVRIFLQHHLVYWQRVQILHDGQAFVNILMTGKCDIQVQTTLHQPCGPQTHNALTTPCFVQTYKYVHTVVALTVESLWTHSLISLSMALNFPSVWMTIKKTIITYNRAFWWGHTLVIWWKYGKWNQILRSIFFIQDDDKKY